MTEAFSSSLLARFLHWLAAIYSESGLHRLGRSLRMGFLRSRTHRIGARVLGSSDRVTEGAGLTARCGRSNARLWRLGRRALPAVEGSLLHRLYHAVFACGRESKILGWLFRGGLTAFLLTVVGLYGVVDYVLRDLLSVPILSSGWDEALLLLSILWIVWERMRAPKPMPARANPLDPWVVLFIGAGLGLLLMVSPHLSIAIEGYRATVQYMLFFFIVTRLLRDEADVKRLYLVMVLAAFLISLHGIYQYIAAVPIPSSWTDQAEQSVRTRVYSIFGSPNIMGDFMVMFAPMAAGLAYWVKDKRAKVFFWFATFCMCFACLFTMSRGAWMAMAVTILLFAILVDRRLIVLMLAALAVSMFLPFVASRIGYLLTPEFQASTNNGGRGSRWVIALDLLNQDPVFGFGLGMFGGAVAMQHKLYPWISYFYVDNYYLKILVEMGWIGLTAFILLMLALLFVGLRAVYRSSQAPRERSTYPLCAGMLSGLCGVLVHCYFENIFEEPYMMAYFWTIAAMLVFLGFLQRREGRAAQGGTP